LAQIEQRFGLSDRGTRTGLTCTETGLSLGRAPLLRLTSSGFAPRPLGELSALLKCAYGHDTRLDNLLSGLDVVADALNREDLGRAMIAAVHLQLPELSREGAARLSVENERLAKFPGQQRNWRGQFAEGREFGARETPPVSPRKPPGGGTSPSVKRPERTSSNLLNSPPFTVAERFAAGEEFIGGGPEDPVADIAAAATLAVGLTAAVLASTAAHPTASDRQNRSTSRSRASRRKFDEDECEELLNKDSINCQIVSAIHGKRKGSICRTVAMERYSECLSGGLSNVRTPPYSGN
jgi:hypothetical protein